MLHGISLKSSKWLLKKSPDIEQELEIYTYGFILFYSTLLISVSILFLSMLVNDFILGVIYIIFFTSVRQYSGGYHANTYQRCFIISNLSFVFTYLISKICFSSLDNIYMTLTVLLISIIYIFTVSPMEHSNQPIAKEDYKKLQFTTGKVLIVDFLLIIFLFLIGASNVAYMATSTILMVAFTLIIAKGGKENGQINRKTNS